MHSPSLTYPLSPSPPPCFPLLWGGGGGGGGGERNEREGERKVGRGREEKDGRRERGEKGEREERGGGGGGVGKRRKEGGGREGSPHPLHLTVTAMLGRILNPLHEVASPIKLLLLLHWEGCGHGRFKVGM